MLVLLEVVMHQKEVNGIIVFQTEEDDTDAIPDGSVPFPAEMEVAIYQEDDTHGPLTSTCAWKVISSHQGDIRRCARKTPLPRR